MDQKRLPTDSDTFTTPLVKSANLDLRHATAYCWHKQHIVPGSHASSILEVASTLVGVHAARLITPYFALRSRLRNVRHEDIHEALYQNKTLIKARCMRGTLHLLPHDVFEHAHPATLAKRLAVCSALFKKHDVTKAMARKLSDAVMAVLKDGPLSSIDLPHKTIEYMKQAGTARSAGWSVVAVRAVIKELWENGSICYVNMTRNFGAEQRSYGITRDFYPTIAGGSGGDETALDNLLRSYIRTYGPVTIGDMTWWSGQDRRRVKRSVERLSTELVELKSDEFEEPFQMTSDDYDAMVRFSPLSKDWVAILAYEDPSLKGYFTTRARYVEKEHYDLLFNAIGEARSSIMLNGRIVGTWGLNKRNGMVESTLFSPLSKQSQKLIEQELAKVQADAFQLLRLSASRDLFG